jgi:hypothetical protein
MSAEKKKNVDTEGLGQLISNMCFALAGLFIMASLLMLLHQEALAGIAFSLILPVIIYTLINAQKYDGNTRNKYGKMKTGTKVVIGSVVGFLVITAIGVSILLYSSSRPTAYSVESGILKISGMYGQEVSIYKISELELKDTMPEVLLKTNGSALNTILKGNFRLRDIGATKLFIDKSKPPCVYLKWDSNVFFINCEDSEKTKELFNKLHDEWKK